VIHYERLGPEDAAAFSHLAFPRHREYLNRLALDGPDPAQRGRPAAAVGASVLGQPIGLALAARARDPSRADVLSIVVAASMRRGGIGSGLLAHLERELSTAGVSELCARVAEGEQSVAFLRLLDRRGYEAFEDESDVWYAARPLRLLESPGLAVTCPGVEIVPLTEELLERVGPLGDAEGFSPTYLSADEFDPSWSFLGRRDGTVVGWMLGHAVAESVRVSSLYTVPGHRSLRLAASLIRTFVQHVADEHVRGVTWEVRLAHRAWCRLMDQLLARYSDERLVIRSRRKTLDAVEHAAEVEGPRAPSVSHQSVGKHRGSQARHDWFRVLGRRSVGAKAACWARHSIQPDWRRD
jgi:GNAT superfamily N-acetyltransferase